MILSNPVVSIAELNQRLTLLDRQRLKLAYYINISGKLLPTLNAKMHLNYFTGKVRKNNNSNMGTNTLTGSCPKTIRSPYEIYF